MGRATSDSHLDRSPLRPLQRLRTISRRAKAKGVRLPGCFYRSRAAKLPSVVLCAAPRKTASRERRSLHRAAVVWNVHTRKNNREDENFAFKSRNRRMRQPIDLRTHAPFAVLFLRFRRGLLRKSRRYAHAHQPKYSEETQNATTLFREHSSQIDAWEQISCGSAFATHSSAGAGIYIKFRSWI